MTAGAYIAEAFQSAAAEAVDRLDPPRGGTCLVSGYRTEDFVESLHSHVEASVVAHDVVRDGALSDSLERLPADNDAYISSWYPAFTPDFLLLDPSFASRVLKPGGKMQVIFSNPISPKKILYLIRKALRKEKQPGKFQKSPFQLETPKQLRRWLQHVGFSDCRAYGEDMPFTYTEPKQALADFKALGGSAIIGGLPLPYRNAVESYILDYIGDKCRKKPYLVKYQYLVGMAVYQPPS